MLAGHHSRSPPTDAATLKDVLTVQLRLERIVLVPSDDVEVQTDCESPKAGRRRRSGTPPSAGLHPAQQDDAIWHGSPPSLAEDSPRVCRHNRALTPANRAAADGSPGKAPRRTAGKTASRRLAGGAAAGGGDANSAVSKPMTRAAAAAAAAARPGDDPGWSLPGSQVLEPADTAAASGAAEAEAEPEGTPPAARPRLSSGTQTPVSRLGAVMLDLTLSDGVGGSGSDEGRAAVATDLAPPRTAPKRRRLGLIISGSVGGSSEGRGAVVADLAPPGTAPRQGRLGTEEYQLCNHALLLFSVKEGKSTWVSTVAGLAEAAAAAHPGADKPKTNPTAGRVQSPLVAERWAARLPAPGSGGQGSASQQLPPGGSDAASDASALPSDKGPRHGQPQGAARQLQYPAKQEEPQGAASPGSASQASGARAGNPQPFYLHAGKVYRFEGQEQHLAQRAELWPATKQNQLESNLDDGWLLHAKAVGNVASVLHQGAQVMLVHASDVGCKQVALYGRLAAARTIMRCGDTIGQSDSLLVYARKQITGSGSNDINFWYFWLQHLLKGASRDEVACLLCWFRDFPKKFITLLRTTLLYMQSHPGATLDGRVPTAGELQASPCTRVWVGDFELVMVPKNALEAVKKHKKAGMAAGLEAQRSAFCCSIFLELEGSDQGQMVLGKPRKCKVQPHPSEVLPLEELVSEEPGSWRPFNVN